MAKVTWEKIEPYLYKEKNGEKVGTLLFHLINIAVSVITLLICYYLFDL